MKTAWAVENSKKKLGEEDELFTFMPLIKEKKNQYSTPFEPGKGTWEYQAKPPHHITVTYSNIVFKPYTITLYTRKWYSRKFSDMLDWP